jgi:hypothetical protein
MYEHQFNFNTVDNKVLETSVSYPWEISNQSHIYIYKNEGLKHQNGQFWWKMGQTIRKPIDVN